MSPFCKPWPTTGNGIENARLFEQAGQRAIELTQAKEAAERASKEAQAEKERAEIAKEGAGKGQKGSRGRKGSRRSGQRGSRKARKDAEAANRSLATQMWQTAGQALLNERMRGEQDVPTLAGNVVDQLCAYLDAQVGALYVMEEEVLKLAGTYAYRRENSSKQFRVGESLVGQAALKKRTIVVRVPTTIS